MTPWSTRSRTTCRPGRRAIPVRQWEGADLYSARTEALRQRRFRPAAWAEHRGPGGLGTLLRAGADVRGAVAVHLGHPRGAGPRRRRTESARPPHDFRTAERRNRADQRAVVLARESRRPVARGCLQESNLSRTRMGRNARERWAELTNHTLARVGRDDRVDHRSYERQGVDREPGRHFGPPPRTWSAVAASTTGWSRQRPWSARGRGFLNQSRNRRAGDRAELAGARFRRAPRPGRRLLGLHGLESYRGRRPVPGGGSYVQCP